MKQAPHSFAARARVILLAWVALLALMLTSLGSAYLRLGVWNPVIGLLIAGIKSCIVAWIFMGLARSSAVLRIVAVLGLAMVAVLFGLSGVDYATRVLAPAAVQQPQQLQSTDRLGMKP